MEVIIMINRLLTNSIYHSIVTTVPLLLLYMGNKISFYIAYFVAPHIMVGNRIRTRTQITS